MIQDRDIDSLKRGYGLIYRSYISDANAQRKYEDGKALQEALNEIRAEIARVTSGAVR